MSTESTIYIDWPDGGRRRWLSANGHRPPQKFSPGDDQLPADTAYRRISQGEGILWQGDFNNARQLLQAVARRFDNKPAKKLEDDSATGRRDFFNRYRLHQAQRANAMHSLILPVDNEWQVPLRRAPNWQQACTEALGTLTEPAAIALADLVAFNSASQWRIKGVSVAALAERIHPYYGVFSPLRGEYIDLLASQLAVSRKWHSAFDIGAGTGIISALLAQHGIKNITATDTNQQALTCARDNIQRLGFAKQVTLLNCDLYPDTRTDLIVCNPPWLPGKPSSALEAAIYDPAHRMLQGVLNQATAHLNPGGQLWLIMSDLAELLGLRPAEYLAELIDASNLTVVACHQARASHPKSRNESDPLYFARSLETCTLWQLQAAKPV